MSIRKVTVPGLAKLNTFCHAVIAGDFIHVSGTLGTRADSMDLVAGGTGAQAAQTLRKSPRLCQAGMVTAASCRNTDGA